MTHFLFLRETARHNTMVDDACRTTSAKEIKLAGSFSNAASGIHSAMRRQGTRRVLLRQQSSFSSTTTSRTATLSVGTFSSARLRTNSSSKSTLCTQEGGNLAKLGTLITH